MAWELLDADGRPRAHVPGRPFDEIERQLVRSMLRWLGGTVQERIGQDHSTVEAILDLGQDES